MTKAMKRPEQRGKAIQTVVRLVNEGLAHSHFEFQVCGSTTNNNRRRLEIRAGKNYLFLIDRDDIR